MRSPGKMEMVKIIERRKEAEGIVSLLFEPVNNEKWKDLIPGQFLMVWVPGVDEVPMSLSYHFGDPLKLGISVQNIGTATNALCSLKEGDMIGIRGPYGNGFTLPSKEEKDLIIGVSGGVGVASTILPLEWAHGHGFRTMNLVGSRSKANLAFKPRWEAVSDPVHFTTDDGSFGHHGFVTEVLEKELEKMTEDQRKKTIIFTCGPEVMMDVVKRILDRFGVEGQYSLERFMKCGIGVCDSCSVSGRRVCMDGPVFTEKQLKELYEFGKFHRNRSGHLVALKECVN